jgi:threonine/homoserine/homoserine lactone efflux protein
MLYALARSLAGGRREGVLSSSGTFVGGMVMRWQPRREFPSSGEIRGGIRDGEVRRRGLSLLPGIRMIADARRDNDSLPADTAVWARNPFWQGLPRSAESQTALLFLSFIPLFVQRVDTRSGSFCRLGLFP